MRGRPPAYSDECRSAVCAAYAEGRAVRSIAVDFGLCEASVRRYVRAGGLALRPKRGRRMEDPILSALTTSERADYHLVKQRMRYTRAEALRAIGRSDLIEAAS